MSTDVIKRRIAEYLAGEANEAFRREISRLLSAGDWSELEDRFYRDLEFGTGGLRGVIGGGYNRMNCLVVRRATQGLSDYVLKAEGGRRHSAVIAYDSRRYSELFARDAALVFAANGIQTYLFNGVRPTPELSFAVRRLGATIGVVITASHNPPEYNGYKVYWSDGAQIVAPQDAGIIAEVLAVGTDIRSIDEADALGRGLLVRIDEEIDGPYCDLIRSQLLRTDLLASRGGAFPVIYTPLHGTGAYLLERIMRSLGVELVSVPQQREPDGEFPTVKSPNPEEASALDMAVRLGRERKAALVMGTDPDADRLGIAVPAADDFVLLTGNQLGALLADYVFLTRGEYGRLPARPAFVKTIVTSELQQAVAESYGASCFDVLTGFKYIAALIRAFEKETDGHSYVFGGEESYGYLATTEVRDKDAISAAALAVEMAVYWEERKIGLLGRLHELYRRFGWYREEQISKTLRGEKGLQAMQSLMESLRREPPARLGGRLVVKVRDYRDGTVRDMLAQAVSKSIELPSSNVLQFVLESGDLVSVRPSGTEPKIKFYISCRTEPDLEREDAEGRLERAVASIRTDLGNIVRVSNAAQ